MDEKQQYFNDVAGQWDQMRRQFLATACGGLPSPPPPDHARGRLSSMWATVPVSRDAALEAGARVIGVDASEGMIERSGNACRRGVRGARRRRDSFP